ncbi:acylglycerol kinase activity, partial [Pristimantis euphronides]
MPLDVLQIKGEQEQPVFALSRLRWGSYRDAAAEATKYWYLGLLKTRAAHLFSTLKEWPQRHEASILFLGPAERQPEDDVTTITGRPPLYIRIYRRLARYWSPPKVELPVEVSPESWEESQLSAVELSISTQNHHPDLTRTLDSMSVCIEPDTVGKFKFISLGVKTSDPRLCPDLTRQSLPCPAARGHIGSLKHRLGGLRRNVRRGDAAAQEASLLLSPIPKRKVYPEFTSEYI